MGRTKSQTKDPFNAVADIRSKWRQPSVRNLYFRPVWVSRYKSPAAAHKIATSACSTIHLSLFFSPAANSGGGEVNICRRSDPAARWPFYRSICRAEPNMKFRSFSPSLFLPPAGCECCATILRVALCSSPFSYRGPPPTNALSAACILKRNNTLAYIYAALCVRTI